MATARIQHRGPWQVPYAVNVLCPDGVRRTAAIHPEQHGMRETPWIGASVRVAGHWVRGYLRLCADGDMQFSHYAFINGRYVFNAAFQKGR